MSTTSGQMLSHYRLVEKLGEGGMGVVWRALDTRLARDVAIKTLPDLFSGHPERLARFEREARALAALNHPNIGQIYGIEQAEADPGAPPMLVLEYVPGEGLDARLDRGRLSIEEALGLALQIAGGLEAAHELGIIHRDLKPANIRLTPDERIKILDFGLAKVLATGGASNGDSAAGVTDWPTVSSDHTRAGAFLGTVGYMSPEQARGKAVDRRTDIWSFGCILFECLTGLPPFPGDTVADRIGAILHLEPVWSLLPPGTPPAVRDLLRRCLEKDPKRRLRDIGDARLELERLLSGRVDDAPPRGLPLPGAAVSSGAARHARVAAFALGCALAALVLWNMIGPGTFWAPRVAPRAEARLSINVPKGIVMLGGKLAADGRSAFIHAAPLDDRGRPDHDNAQIYRRALDDFELRPIPGTLGAKGFMPAPDGRSLLVFSFPDESRTRLQMMRVAVDGSAPPTPIAEINDKWNDASVMPNGDVVLVAQHERTLRIVPAVGGTASEPIPIDIGNARAQVHGINPLPDGEHAFAQAMWYTDGGFQMGVALLHVASGKGRILLDDGGNAQYAPTGHILFTRADTLYGARFGLDSLDLESPPVALLAGVRTEDAWMPGMYSFNGSNLAFVPGGIAGRQRGLAMISTEGGDLGEFGDERRAYVYAPRTSRDGRRIATVVVTPGALYEIWVAEHDNPSFRRFIATADADVFEPTFSPDGSELAYLRLAKNDEDGIYVRPLAGGPARRVLRFNGANETLYPVDWSGDRLIVRRFVGNSYDLLQLRLTGREAGVEDLRPFLTGPAYQPMARFSPDGRFVAFTSDESGPFSVHVAPVLQDGSLGESTIASTNGGFLPAWSADGRTLYHVNDDEDLVAVPIAADGTPGRAVVLRDANLPGRIGARGGLAVAPLADGSLLYVSKGPDEEQVTQINLVLNFDRELTRRLP